MLEIANNKPINEGAKDRLYTHLESALAANNFNVIKKVINLKTINEESELHGTYNDELNHFINPNNPKRTYCQRLDINDNLRCYSLLAYMDMQAFKAINDYLSEDVGDLIISYAADFLTCLLSQYGFFVTRKGGEEFIAYFMDNPKAVCTAAVNRTEPVNNVPDKLECNNDVQFTTLDIDALLTRLIEPNDEFYKNNKRYEDCDSSSYNWAFGKEELCIFVPNHASSGPYILKRMGKVFEDDKAQYPLKEKDVRCDFANYRFRIFITGISFRFGVGTVVSDAEKEAAKKKSKRDSARRGDFGIGVKLGVIEENDKIRWYNANCNIFIIVNKKDHDIRNRLKQTFGSYTDCTEHEDNIFTDIIYFIISFDRQKASIEALKSAYEKTINDYKDYESYNSVIVDIINALEENPNNIRIKISDAVSFLTEAMESRHSVTLLKEEFEIYLKEKDPKIIDCNALINLAQKIESKLNFDSRESRLKRVKYDLKRAFNNEELTRIYLLRNISLDSK